MCVCAHACGCIPTCVCEAEGVVVVVLCRARDLQAGLIRSHQLQLTDVSSRVLHSLLHLQQSVQFRVSKYYYTCLPLHIHQRSRAAQHYEIQPYELKLFLSINKMF